MTRVEEFDAFYDSTRQYVLHLTYALCGDLSLATAAVKHAYADTWQSWPKIRNRDPLGFVRSEAWRQTVLQRSTQLIRRRGAKPVDQELLDALRDVPGNARRLYVLQTIGELELADAAREVGVTEETAVSATEGASAALRKRLGVDSPAIESRLWDLRTVSDEVSFERPSLARRRARRKGRRRTVAIAAAGVLAVAAAGAIVTQGGPLDNAADVSRQLPVRNADVEELPVTDDDMLDEDQLHELSGSGRWKIADTGSDISERDRLSACPAQRFADRRASAGWVRSFEQESGKSDQTAVQALEVSQDEEGAERAFRRTVRWYADCAVPRVQLMDSFTVNQGERETVIMRLRRWDDPVRTYLVGVSKAGSATSTVVHQTKGRKTPPVKAFSQTFDTALTSICDEDDQACQKPGKLRSSLPPETSTATGFLGVVDLPPVADVHDLWVGTEPENAQKNVSSTECDKADFTAKRISGARARSFVIPEHETLSETPFGISQSLGSFANPKAAAGFTDDIIGRVGGCEDKNLSATVSDQTEISGKVYTGKVWQLTFEVNAKRKVTYRMGIVRSGKLVTQVTFFPEPKYDIGGKEFAALVHRAGERLATRGSDDDSAKGAADGSGSSER